MCKTNFYHYSLHFHILYLVIWLKLYVFQKAVAALEEKIKNLQDASKGSEELQKKLRDAYQQADSLKVPLDKFWFILIFIQSLILLFWCDLFVLLLLLLFFSLCTFWCFIRCIVLDRC